MAGRVSPTFAEDAMRALYSNYTSHRDVELENSANPIVAHKIRCLLTAMVQLIDESKLHLWCECVNMQLDAVCSELSAVRALVKLQHA